MGYSYHKNLRTGRYNLCCDFCGSSGNTKKYRCPFGYCPPIAACPKCHKEHKDKFSKEFHRSSGCEKGHRDFERKNKQRELMLASGQPVRCSALSTGNGQVHVLFQTQVGTYSPCVGYYMSKATYDSIPLGDNATPDNYRVYGELTPAPEHFEYSKA